MRIFSIIRFGVLVFAIAFIADIAQADHAAPERDGLVKFVRDGDSVKIIGIKKSVRILGIDAPERKCGAAAQPFYLESKNTLTKLVRTTRLDLVPGKKKSGSYGRRLFYLMLPDGTDVQREMLSRGLAMATAYPPDLDHLDEYLRAEAEAKRNRVGMWGHDYFAVRDLDHGQKLPVISEDRSCPTRFTGTVTEVTITGKRILLTIADQAQIKISQKNWDAFWDGQSVRDLKGKRVTVQGRLNSKGQMHLRHPSMLVPNE